MDLHRTGKRSQWEDVPAHKRNRWQQIAKGTRGVLTPGNAVSFAGAALVAWGLFYVYNGALAIGLFVLSIGRLADIADGMVAARTKTKSPLGELIDAAIDKLSMLAALIVLVWAEAVPLPVAIVFASLNLLNVFLGIAAKLRNQDIHPSRTGKYASALQWSAFLLYVATELLRRHSVDGLAESAAVLAAGAVVLGLLVGAGAVRGYAVAASGRKVKEANGEAKF